ncbi:hypothetical protein ASC64_07315 [Nocardioides sp. Root122]|nr:hypothetical protein ASC64_07315 [Nocardioides sp. Root122]
MAIDGGSITQLVSPESAFAVASPPMPRPPTTRHPGEVLAKTAIVQSVWDMKSLEVRRPRTDQ